MRLWECGRYCKVCSRRVLVVVPREERLIGRRAIGGAGTGPTAWREEKGQEASGGLKMYFETLVIYERRVHFHAPESLSESILSSALPCLAPRFRVEAVSPHHDLASTVQTH